MDYFYYERDPEINLYYTRLFDQFFKAATSVGKKFIIAFLLFLSFVLDFTVIVTKSISDPIKIINVALISIIVCSLPIALAQFVGLFLYKSNLRSFKPMIQACQVHNSHELLEKELKNYKNINMKPFDQVYSFFMAVSYFQAERFQDCLVILEKLAKTVETKYDLKYEIFFFLAKTHLQVEDLIQSKMYFEQAFESFTKKHYQEPLTEINNLLASNQFN